MKRKTLICLTLVGLLLMGTALPGFASALDQAKLDEYLGRLDMSYLEDLPLTEEPITLTILTLNTVNKPMKDLIAVKWWEQETGIKIEWIETASLDDYRVKANTMIAAGNPPDIFGRNSFTDAEIIQYGADGILIPHEDLLKEHVPILMEAAKTHPEILESSYAPDGHIYFMPHYVYDDHNVVSQGYVLNKDWLTKLNLEAPKTIEALYEVFKAFKAAGDLNGNGLADEYPFAWNGIDSDGLNSFFGIFGMADNKDDHLFMKDGKPYYVPAQESYKEAITWLHRFYEEGLVDPEVFSMDQTTFRSKAGEAAYGMIYCWGRYHFRDDYEKDTCPYDYYPPIVKEGVKPTWNVTPLIVNHNAFSISSACEDPVLAARFANYLCEEYVSMTTIVGVLTVECELLENGQWKQFPQTANLFERPNGFFKYVDEERFRKMAYSGIQNEKQKRNDTIASAVDLSIRYPQVFMSLDDADQLSRYAADLNAYIASQQAKWIVEGGVEQEWDNYLKTLNDMGLGEVMAIYEKYV